MPKVMIRRRALFFLFVAVTLIVTFAHLTGFGSWNGPLPRPEPIRKPPAPPPAEPELEPFRWSDLGMQYPISSVTPLPSGTAPEIPRIQYDFDQTIQSTSLKKENGERLAAVKEAFEHSWKGYKKHAWLHDEVVPVQGGFRDPFGGWGATLVDSLDTLWIMGLTEEFEEALKAIKTIDFTKSALSDLNVFETTIRYLGGFLSAHDLTDGKYPILLDKAVELGDMLYRAFDTPNHMPIARWKWKEYVKGATQVTPSNEVVAEIGSLSLEFTRLSQLTSDPRYYDVVQRVADVFAREQNATLIPGLWPISVNPRDENMHSDNSFTLGGMSDSAYEYLPKEYLLLSGRNEGYRSLYLDAIEAVKQYLVFEPLIPPWHDSPASTLDSKSPLLLGTCRVNDGHISLETRGEHLSCFAGGMMALAARAMSPFQSSSETDEDLDVAQRLAKGCVWTYAATPTGIGPEISYTHPCRKGRDAVSGGKEVDWEEDNGDCTWDSTKWKEYTKNEHLPEGFTEVHDAGYILRPEAIESVFMMYRITGDRIWQEHAWTMFQHITSHARTEIAFASVTSVLDAREGGMRLMDKMESFWTAETLKYFYLIFADEDLVSLDEFVFNTEAHPFRWREAVLD